MTPETPNLRGEMLRRDWNARMRDGTCVVKVGEWTPVWHCRDVLGFSGDADHITSHFVDAGAEVRIVNGQHLQLRWPSLDVAIRAWASAGAPVGQAAGVSANVPLTEAHWRLLGEIKTGGPAIAKREVWAELREWGLVTEAKPSRLTPAGERLLSGEPEFKQHRGL